MLNCHDATRLLSEAQDQPTRLRDRVALKLHLSMCSACRNFGEQVSFLRRVSRAYVAGAAERRKAPPAGEDPGNTAPRDAP